MTRQELYDWLAARALGDTTILAVIPNTQLDRMTRQQLREWHCQLEADYQHHQADTPPTPRGGAPDVR